MLGAPTRARAEAGLSICLYLIGLEARTDQPPESVLVEITLTYTCAASPSVAKLGIHRAWQDEHDLSGDPGSGYRERIDDPGPDPGQSRHLGRHHPGIFLTVYYYLTFTHLVHGFWGILGMLWVLARHLAGAYTAEDHCGLEALASYWHATDIIWLIIFPLFYVLA